ncbi:Rap1a/Tai family immunity protein [Rhizobium johnstonii]
MKNIVIVAALALGASVKPAHSDYFQGGNNVYKLCTTGLETSFSGGFCLGFVMGVADNIETMVSLRDEPQCIRSNVSARQVADVVVKYLKDHPEKRDRPAADLAFLAITEAFCPATTLLR